MTPGAERTAYSPEAERLAGSSHRNVCYPASSDLHPHHFFTLGPENVRGAGHAWIEAMDGAEHFEGLIGYRQLVPVQ